MLKKGGGTCEKEEEEGGGDATWPVRMRYASVTLSCSLHTCAAAVNVRTQEAMASQKPQKLEFFVPKTTVLLVAHLRRAAAGGAGHEFGTARARGQTKCARSAHKMDSAPVERRQEQNSAHANRKNARDKKKFVSKLNAIKAQRRPARPVPLPAGRPAGRAGGCRARHVTPRRSAHRVRVRARARLRACVVRACVRACVCVRGAMRALCTQNARTLRILDSAPVEQRQEQNPAQANRENARDKKKRQDKRKSS